MSKGIAEVSVQAPRVNRADRKEPNGAFVETVLAAVKQRIEFYQEVSGGRFACDANALAIEAVEEALAVLDQRTKEREARAVEGTHAV